MALLLPPAHKRAAAQTKLNEAKTHIAAAIHNGETPHRALIAQFSGAWQARDWTDEFDPEGQGFERGVQAGMLMMCQLYDKNKPSTDSL